ncbi:divinyl protochlorophyllide a 8-vinyl-reductase [Blastomonas natatoria]|uniref:Divinyl protochlorophyllide a 8-vinyl-reductase n=1 Tax=Blastomonas natatoria TaxID=34015 RepID=A0A2V3VPL7_9SPHN|nr:divinyl protochlorophyllide a 8-vinyl-reductase [Blastomonas natatoria]
MADAPSRAGSVQAHTGALIGPNAVLQLAWAMEGTIGADAAREVLEVAGIDALPSGETMIAEAEALRLHQALAILHPDAAEQIAEAAAIGTADYIIAHRIPRLAAMALRWLPAPLAARLLMRAIERHAWTFVGAGHFTVTGPWHFIIDRSRSGDATDPPDTLFLWYAHVFARLYSRLVRARSGCTGAAPDPRYPSRWHYRIAPVTTGAAPARAAPPARGAIRQSPAPASAARLHPESSAPPASRVPS